MDSVLSSLGTLINNIKNLTLPGLVAALGFAILLWPPQPIDVVTDATENTAFNPWPITNGGLAELANTERRIKSDSKLRGEKSQAEQKPWETKDFRPVCETKQRVLRQSQGLSENKPVAVANQFSLEEIQRHLQDCADKETALSGAEQSLITDITAEVGVLSNERDAIRDTYLSYEKTANPLRGVFLDELHKKEDEIRLKQTEIHQEEQLARERTRRSAELTHYSDEIKQRLLEPGRLRPLQKFDDFLSSLGSHVVAFLSLALGWSLLFDPLNRAVFGFIYDRGFDDQLDYVWWDSNSRPTRITLTNQARLEEYKKVQKLYAETGPDVPGAKVEPPPPLREHQPPKGTSFLWPLGFCVMSVIVLAVLMSHSLFHPPPDAPNVSICLVNDCNVLRQAPNFGLLFGGCLAAIVAGLSLALALTWCWSWWKAKVRQKEVDVANIQLKTLKDEIQSKENTYVTEAGNIRSQMKGLSGEALKEKENELKKLEMQNEEDKNKQEVECKCPNGLAAQWLKIRQPEYAIGQGLITRDAYNAIRDEYYTQSTLSIGIILPFLLLMFALLSTPQMGLAAPEFNPSAWVWIFFILVQTFLVLVGADRRHKFDMEVEMTIASTFMKNCEAAKKAADDKAGTTPTTIDLIRQELKKAKIVQAQNLTISPSDDSTTT